MREKELEPFDAKISKQIPGKSADEYETARIAIRLKYSKMQEKIDAANSAEEIKSALSEEIIFETSGGFL